MGLILGVTAFIFVIVMMIILLLFLLLNKDSTKSKNSKYIVNNFEPDNTSPKITELVEYHKAKDSIKYIIESDDNYGRNE